MVSSGDPERRAFPTNPLPDPSANAGGQHTRGILLMLRSNNENIEQLLTTVAVVAALFLSLVVGLGLTVSRDELVFGDYRNLILQGEFQSSLEFRWFVVQELEQSNFNFTVTLGSAVFDIKALLLTHTPGATDPHGSNAEWVRDLLVASEITYAEMVPQRVSAFISARGFRTTSSVYCEICFWAIWTSCMCLFLCLWLVIAYHGSQVQALHAKGNSVPLIWYNRFALPLGALACLMLSASVMLFIAMCGHLVRTRFPFWLGPVGFGLWAWAVATPTFAFTPVIGIFLMFFVVHKGRASKRVRPWIDEQCRGDDRHNQIIRSRSSEAAAKRLHDEKPQPVELL
mmetsp:Transcript_29288/g.67921  ORF Transcript_29288/g.67921 Transcript_29288/m.67921 type:complete len:342 (+) Transcript_29288:56-1081(+)